MRGRKETLGSIKEGARSKSRASSSTAVKTGAKMGAKTAGHAGAGLGGTRVAGRKATTAKGGTHK